MENEVNRNSDLSPAMQRAIEQLKAGETVKAEEMMLQAAREAEQKFGADSPQTANAYNELGTILFNVDNVAAAVQAYRRACAGPMPKEELALRDRLTFLMNLGMALQYDSKFEEAEEVLRQGVDGRKNYYGVDHAGYAFGLEPLATLLMQSGKLAESLDLFEETVENFWQNRHPRLATALALRAEALKMADRRNPPFAELDKVGDPEAVTFLAEEIIGHVITRLQQQTDPAILSQVLQSLLPVIRKHCDVNSELMVNALSMIANLESMRGSEGDISIRIDCVREVIAILDRLNRPEEALQAVQSLALALSDTDQPDAAVLAYRDATERAARLKDKKLQSQVRRNFGLLLSDMKRDAEAEAELQGAVELGKASGDSEMFGRALVALGIFCQHRDRLADAKEHLSQALQKVNPAHPDAVVARSHLKAVEAGQTCGCGNQEEAVAAAFREFVMNRLPQDLLDEFEVELKDNDFKIKVGLNREATEDELEHLNRVINHALAEFKRKLQQQA